MKGKTDAKRTPLKATFGPAFRLATEDEEFQLQFRYLSQIDYRGYTQSNQDPVASGLQEEVAARVRVLP